MEGIDIRVMTASGEIEEFSFLPTFIKNTVGWRRLMSLGLIG